MALLPKDFSFEDMESDIDEMVRADLTSCGNLALPPVFSQDEEDENNSDQNMKLSILETEPENDNSENVFLSPNSKPQLNASCRTTNPFLTPKSKLSSNMKNVENDVFLSPRLNFARSATSLRQPFRDITQTHGAPVLITPTKPNDNDSPVTPTANLKMLMSAISPEIRIRDQKKELFKRQQKNECTNSVSSSTAVCDDLMTDSNIDGHGSRKDKSLGLLSQKFLSRFPEYPDICQSIEIGLDCVAKELGVERRRIYDIVNVLESVEIVSRVGKNRYAWHGKTNLIATLSKLKAFGLAEGYLEKINVIKQLENCKGISGNVFKQQLMKLESNENNQSSMALMAAKAMLRKDKSLGIMSQKFLMLFLVADPSVINLDLAAKIIIGEEINTIEQAKYKTKIRRLYDIANILTSLGLIQKCHVTNISGRKPGFRYIGPPISMDGDTAESTVTQPSAAQESRIDIKPEISTPKKPFARHSSFEQICQVVEQERDKLYRASRSSSLPSTPKINKVAVRKIPSVSVKPAFFARGSIKLTKPTINPKVSSLLKSSASLRGTKPVIKTCQKPQTTILQVSKEQLQVLLETLANKQKNNVEMVDASTQSSPHPPLPGLNGYKSSSVDDAVSSKRLCDTFELPASKRCHLSSHDAEVAEINMPAINKTRLISYGRPSPLRALHLEPEFKVSCSSSSFDLMENELASPLSSDFLDENDNTMSFTTLGSGDIPRGDGCHSIINVRSESEYSSSKMCLSVGSGRLNSGHPPKFRQSDNLPILRLNKTANNLTPNVVGACNTPTRQNITMKPITFSPKLSGYQNTPGGLSCSKQDADRLRHDRFTYTSVNQPRNIKRFLPIRRLAMPKDNLE